jgi:hypothetical protein
MKAYVNENAGPLATTGNGRLSDGVTFGLSVAANASLAPTFQASFALRNLLDVIQEISTAALVDFAVTHAPGTTSFTFNTYYPRKGADRTGTAPFVFSIEHANMSQPYATESHVDEFNSSLVMGQGEGSDRQFVVRDDANAQAASPWNRIEKAHDARQESDTDALESVGDQQLREGRATSRISFNVIESPVSIYGRDFQVGDLVLARFDGVEQIKKIIGVEITVSDGRETLRIHFNDE